MRVTVIPIVTDTLGTLFKGLERELGELKINRQIKTTQTSARIMRRVLDIWRDWLSIRLHRCEKLAIIIIEHLERNYLQLLGILEVDIIKLVEMKEKVRKQFFRRTRKLFKTKFFSKNLVKGINSWEVPLVRYSGQFLKWTQDEYKQMEQRTRKLISMQQGFASERWHWQLVCIEKRCP